MHYTTFMIKRLYQGVISDHFSRNRQMLFFSGPKYSGKTTSSLTAVSPDNYFNWDNEMHRAIILNGPQAVA